MTVEQLTEIRDQLVAADDFADLQIVTVRLIDVLIDQCDQVAGIASHAKLLQLLREAFDYFSDPESKVDRRDWIREARKLLRPDRGLPTAADVRGILNVPVDPRD